MMNKTGLSGKHALPLGASISMAHFSKLLLVTLLLSACGTTGYKQKSLNNRQAMADSSLAGQADMQATLAQQFLLQGQHQLAIPYFKKAITRSDQKVPLYIGLGQSLVAVGEYEEAKGVYEKALQISPNNIHALAGLAKVYMAYQQLTVAENMYELALQQDQKDADIYVGLAVVKDAQGDHAAALELYEEGLKHFPEDVSLLSNRALSQALSDDLEPALQTLTDLSRSPYSSVQIRQNLALAHSLAGNRRLAIQLAAIDLQPLAAEETVNSFGQLAGLSPMARTRALLYGVIEERHDREHVANEVIVGTDDNKLAGVQRLLPEPVEPEPVVEPEPEPEPEPEVEMPPIIEPEGWAVQIAAYRYAKEVMPGWRQLKKKYEDIIGHLEPRRSEKDFGAHQAPGPKGFFYRLNAGPLKSFHEALDICQKLEAAGGECWIRPPESTEGRLPSINEPDTAPKNDAADAGAMAPAPTEVTPSEAAAGAPLNKEETEASKKPTPQQKKAINFC